MCLPVHHAPSLILSLFIFSSNINKIQTNHSETNKFPPHEYEQNLAGRRPTPLTGDLTLCLTTSFNPHHLTACNAMQCAIALLSFYFSFSSMASHTKVINAISAIFCIGEVKTEDPQSIAPKKKKTQIFICLSVFPPHLHIFTSSQTGSAEAAIAMMAKINRAKQGEPPQRCKETPKEENKWEKKESQEHNNRKKSNPC